jgi:hypothetical protein
MGSSKSKNSFCLIRRSWVASTPEEAVRQSLLQRMLGLLGYPRGYIAVERGLCSLESLGQPVSPFLFDPNRRIDVLCFYPNREGLIKPLLLVECKALHLNFEAENQLFGYNARVGAPFLCLANEAEIKMLWQERGSIKSIPFLPSYAQLIETLC